jgi:microcystin-dependent protein
MATTGGEETHTLVDAELAAHQHQLTDPGHLHIQNPHNHTLNDPGHNHGLTQTPHAHAITDPGHLHVTPCGRAQEVAPQPQYVGGVGESFTERNTASNVNTTGISIAAANANISLAAALTGQTLVAATAVDQTAYAGISCQLNGGGQAHNNMPPYQVVNFIIKT